MPGFVIDLLGVPDLERAFAVLPAKLQGKILRPALRAGAKVMRDAASRAAPRFTGNMARFLKVRAMKGRRGRVGFLVLTGTKQELQIPERTKGGHPRGYYPVAIEYGWHPTNRAGTAAPALRRRRDGTEYQYFRRLTGAEIGTSKVPANPWMHRAFAASRQAAMQKIAEEIRTRITGMTLKALEGGEAAA